MNSGHLSLRRMWQLQTPLQKGLLITASAMFVVGVALAVAGLLIGGAR